MMQRKIGFHWLSFDNISVFDKPGRFGIKGYGHEGYQSIASSQLVSLIVTDLENTAGDVMGLVETIEARVAGAPGPPNLMSGMDGSVYLANGVVLVNSDVVEEYAVLLTSDSLMKVLRGVHAVFTSPDYRNPDASFDDVHYEVLAEGEAAFDGYVERGGTYTSWQFDPKKCTFVYEGMPDDMVYPHPIPQGFKDLCE